MIKGLNSVTEPRKTWKFPRPFIPGEHYGYVPILVCLSFGVFCATSAWQVSTWFARNDARLTRIEVKVDDIAAKLKVPGKKVTRR